MVTKSMIQESSGNPKVVLYKALKNTFVHDLNTKMHEPQFDPFLILSKLKVAETQSPI